MADCSFGLLARGSRGARVLRATAHRALPFFQFLHAYSASIRGTRFPLSSATGEPFQTFSCLVLFFLVSHQSFSRSFFSSYFLSLSPPFSLKVSLPLSSPYHLVRFLFLSTLSDFVLAVPRSAILLKPTDDSINTVLFN